MKKILLFVLALSVSLSLPAQRLVILHTNDTHSHIDPSREGLGGVIERAAYIDSVRQADGKKNVLLLDAGDFSQGTSYFPKLHGDLEIDILNAMKYDVVTLGNHEFDNGLDELLRRVKRCKCPIVCANYEFEGHPLGKAIKPYAIVKKAGLKIGIIGLLTPEVKAVVNADIAKRLKLIDTEAVVNKYARILKEDKKCDLVICLTHIGHIGHGYTDPELAAATTNVDIIVGGHSHTFLEDKEVVKNPEGKDVVIVTNGCWALNMGHLLVEY